MNGEFPGDEGGMALSLCATCNVKTKLPELKVKVVSLVMEIRKISEPRRSITGELKELHPYEFKEVEQLSGFK